MYWLRNFTATENYQWKCDGLPAVAPFPFWAFPDTSQEELDAIGEWVPHEFGRGEPCNVCADLGFAHCFPDYLDVAMGFILRREPVLHIPKTREMMTSWLVVGYLTWFCQFYPQTQAFSQSESMDKAVGNIEYANILYRNQKPWMKEWFPLASPKKDQGSRKTIAWKNSSSYTALPGGIRKIASKHPSVYFMDEAAHLPNGNAILDIAMPCVRQIIAVSSAAPGWFAGACGL